MKRSKCSEEQVAYALRQAVFAFTQATGVYPGLYTKTSERSPQICSILFIIICLGCESTDMEDKQGVLF